MKIEEILKDFESDIVKVNIRDEVLDIAKTRIEWLIQEAREEEREKLFGENYNKPLLTRQQFKTLNVIEKFIQKEGYMPPIRYIADKMKLSSKSTVHQHIVELRKKGYLPEPIYNN